MADSARKKGTVPFFSIRKTTTERKRVPSRRVASVHRLAGMPRTARSFPGGICYHVINRGNARARVFHDAHDYDAFLALSDQACARLPMRIPAWCLMPNHFHYVLWPHEDGDVSRWVHWLLSTHAQRHHRQAVRARAMYGKGGSRRSRAGRAIQQDEHLLQVVAYVVLNPVRAGLVESAERWRWSGVGTRSQSPVAFPVNESSGVGQPYTERELEEIRRSSIRGTPFGGAQWTLDVASRLGLSSTLKPRGRPRKPSQR